MTPRSVDFEIVRYGLSSPDELAFSALMRIEQRYADLIALLERIRESHLDGADHYTSSLDIDTVLAKVREDQF